ncbi:Sporulation protein [Enhygromyxa salina]|uniref:Sporulation protein n=1 Tax=Enhygromyxa salina TaxID=215803 RepID=A0A0C1ZPB9_9BACT|nr:hypothetical protein [Enhygromyxa salina]KIG19469.1 Sporulation protein [Enhygromyxa salina]
MPITKLPQITKLPSLAPADSFDTVGVELSDKSLLKIANDMLSEIKAATFRVGLGMSLPDDPNSWEQVIRKRLDVVPSDIRGRAAHQLERDYGNKLIRARELGRFADINLADRNVLAKVRPPVEMRADVGRLLKISEQQGRIAFHPSVPLSPVKATDLQQQDYLYRNIKFMLDKVYCIDETGTDWLGSDEIDMGGTSVDETGDVKKISAFAVSHDFDTGEYRNFNPDKNVHSFSVLEGGDNWPKVYRVTLAMVERDWGDFPAWIGELYNKAKSRVKEYLAGIAAGVGAAVGGPLGALVGAVAGWVVGWVVDNLIGWITTLWEDDLIGSKTFTFTHAGPRATFGGRTRSSTNALVWNGSGGSYRTYTYWELFN